jgi:hypothetical protein
MKDCSSCSNYEPKDYIGCLALNKRIQQNCFAWASLEERIRRIDDMVQYSEMSSSSNTVVGLLIREKNKLIKEMKPMSSVV